MVYDNIFVRLIKYKSFFNAKRNNNIHKIKEA